jgi:hypothetical protein
LLSHFNPDIAGGSRNSESKKKYAQIWKCSEFTVQPVTQAGANKDRENDRRAKLERVTDELPGCADLLHEDILVTRKTGLMSSLNVFGPEKKIPQPHILINIIPKASSCRAIFSRCRMGSFCSVLYCR